MHTPYDGSHPLFKIGLEPLELRDWLEIDEHLDFYLDEKVRLKSLYPNRIFACEENTEAAQREVLDLLIAHLLDHHGDTHRQFGNRLFAGRHEIDPGEALQPLEIAAKLIQEDLILMRKGETGWRLAAASLCFPSSWSLLEKFQKPLHEIHEPVPGFGTGTRNAMMIERIFDNLLVGQPVRRFNWSVYSDDELFHDDRAAEYLSKQDFDAGIFMRVEHQTLRKLPASGDILFTVRIHIDPLEKIMKHPERTRICMGAVESLASLDPAQLNYKGLTNQRDRLILKLSQFAKGEVLS